MKKYFRIAAVLIGGILLASAYSCATTTLVSHDQGRHEGWFKNPNNPHNPNSTKEVKQPAKPEKSMKKK